MYDILELNKMLVSDLRDVAKKLDIKKFESLKKQDLIYKILDQQAIVASDVKKNEKKEPAVERNSRPVSDKPHEKVPRPRTKFFGKKSEKPTKVNIPHEPKKPFIPDPDVERLLEEPESVVIPEREITIEPEEIIANETPKVTVAEEPVQPAQPAQPKPFVHEKIAQDSRFHKPFEREKKERYEFEGIISNSGVLEIMPDGYG
ncbi:MAG: Rho termination factor N-terminal domain-containing protein, partial [Bacteroidota bacterium]|nr:Rho termination factor N-terminal domain-containing protein [Bacteroidota bacterium]